jgi:hypothetical protein
VFASVFAILAAVLVVLFLTVWKPLWAPQGPGPEEQQRRAEIARHLQSAKDEFVRGEYDKAVAEFAIVQSLDPANSDARDGIDKARRAKTAEGGDAPDAKPSQ